MPYDQGAALPSSIRHEFCAEKCRPVQVGFELAPRTCASHLVAVLLSHFLKQPLRPFVLFRSSQVDGRTFHEVRLRIVMTFIGQHQPGNASRPVLRDVITFQIDHAQGVLSMLVAATCRRLKKPQATSTGAIFPDTCADAVIDGPTQKPVPTVTKFLAAHDFSRAHLGIGWLI
jgi:hypothetical protein